MHTTQNYEEALEELAKYGTGPLLEHYSSAPHAFLKNEEAYRSKEFQDLDKAVQEVLQKPDVPSFEIVVSIYVQDVDEKILNEASDGTFDSARSRVR